MHESDQLISLFFCHRSESVTRFFCFSAMPQDCFKHASCASIMQKIHATCVEYGREPDGRVDYIRGANIGGFVKVADAMLAFGIV